MGYKDEVKFHIISDTTILYMTDPKNSNRALSELINIFRKVTGHKINIQYQQLSYMPVMNTMTRKLG